MAYPLARLCVAALLASGLASAQIVFSRRIYNERGRTWQQIWIWSPEGKMKPLTNSSRNHFAPWCDLRRNVILFHTGDDPYDDRQWWSFDRTTKVERPVAAKPAHPPERRVPLVGCESSAWNGEGTRGACTVGQNVIFYDAAQGTISARVRFDARPMPPDVLEWSPNGVWLLVSTMGAKDNSTSRQSDYFVLDTRDNSWKFAGSGNNGFWIPGRNELVYSTPRGLTRLSGKGRHQVWSAQLEIFDPETGKHTEVTKGKSNNIQPAPCVK
jgi:hypothetical protein